MADYRKRKKTTNTDDELFKPIFTSKKRDRMKKKYKEVILNLECCICCEEKPAMVNVDYEYLMLCDVTEDQVPDNRTFYGPCGAHPYCKECLKKIVTNYDNHPINRNYPLVRCMNPGDDCKNTISDLPYYFQHNSLKKILSEEEFEEYMYRADKYRFPGYEVVKCPGTIYIARMRRTYICNNDIMVPLDDIETRMPGKLIISCNQTISCFYRFCYHCKTRVPSYVDVCKKCVSLTENTNPDIENRYFCRVGKVKGDRKPVFYLNKELTKEIVMNHLKEIVEMDRIYVKCFECSVYLYKTEQCNGLDHCGYQMCNVCGRCSTNGKELQDHWSNVGNSGCPRFDYASYWNEMVRCEFRCSENRCYNHEKGDCKKKTHQKGIRKMRTEIKKSMIYHAIKSLLPELREQVVGEMKQMNDKKINYYLPSDDILYVLNNVKSLEVYTTYSEKLVLELDSVKRFLSGESPISSNSPELPEFEQREDNIMRSLMQYIDNSTQENEEEYEVFEDGFDEFDE